MLSSVAPDAGAAPVAVLSRVMKRFQTGRTALTAVDGVSLVVGKRDRLAVIGESGSGKSTIARLLLGTILCDAGSVEVLGNDWARLSDRARRRVRGDLGAVFQEPVDSLNPRMRVKDIVAEPLLVHRKYAARAEIAGRVDHALAEVALEPSLRDRYPDELSGGQAQRVSIARALIGKPRLLIFDEPTSGLDVSVQAQILTLLEDLSDTQRNAWVFVTHDLAVAAEVCSRAIVVHKGQIVEEGEARELLDHPSDAYTKRLVDAVLPPPETERSAVTAVS